MDKEYREALQVTKEIMVKFIEMQRVSPMNFAEVFPSVYQVVLSVIQEYGTESAIQEGKK